MVVAALHRLRFCERRFEPSLLVLQPRRAVGRRRLAQRVRDGRKLRRDLQGVRRGVELGRPVVGRARHDEYRLAVGLDHAAGGAVFDAVGVLRDEAYL